MPKLKRFGIQAPIIKNAFTKKKYILVRGLIPKEINLNIMFVDTMKYWPEQPYKVPIGQKVYIAFLKPCRGEIRYRLVLERIDRKKKK